MLDFIILFVLSFVLGGAIAVFFTLIWSEKEYTKLSELHKEYQKIAENIFKLDDDMINHLNKLGETKDKLISLYEENNENVYAHLIKLRDVDGVEGLDEVIGQLGEVLE